jgi:hypothetical protein
MPDTVFLAGAGGAIGRRLKLQRRFAGASRDHSSPRQRRAMHAVTPMPKRQYSVAVSG